MNVGCSSVSECFCRENLEDPSPSSGQFRDWCFPVLPLGWAAGMSVLHLCAQILSRGGSPECSQLGKILGFAFFSSKGQAFEVQVHHKWPQGENWLLCSVSPSSEMACFFPVSPWVHLINYKADVIYYFFSSGANPDIHAARVNSRAEFIKLSWWPGHDINLEGFRGDQYFTLFLFVFLMLT